MKDFHALNLNTSSSYKATLKGDIFQLKLLMGCALQALNNQGQKFLLNTEVIEAEKFDDLVIEYTDSATVVQAKHSSSDKEYTKSDLMKGYKGEASLAKYFDSFVKIRNKKLLNSKETHFVFFTNRAISKDDNLRDCFCQVSEPDSNLIFQADGSECLKFKDDFKKKQGQFSSIYQDFEEAIKQNSVVYYEMLSQNVVIDVVKHKQNIELSSTDLIKKIANDIVTGLSNGNLLVNLTGGMSKERNLLISMLEQEQDILYRFSEDFIKNNSLKSFQQYFRDELLKEITSKVKLSQVQVTDILSKTQIQLPKKTFNHIWKPQKSPNTVTLMKTMGGANPIWEPSDIESYFIIGMFGEFQFAYNPQQSFPLNDLTIYNTLHVAMLDAIQKSGTINISQVNQKFSTYVEDFFNAYCIKSGQPNEDELEKIIKNKLEVTFRFAGDEYYHDFYYQMSNWMKDIKGKWLDRQQVQDFFDNVSKKVKRLHLVGYSQHYTLLLSEYRLNEFEHPLQESILDFLIKSKQPICVLHGDDPIGQTLIACNTVNQLIKKGMLNEDDWGFVDDQCRILEKIPAGLSVQFKLMVVDKTDSISLQNPELLSSIIKTTIMYKKKLILILSSNSLEKIKGYISNADLFVELLYSSLDDNAVKKLCNKYLDNFIQLAGRNIKINDILEAKCGGIYKFMTFATHLIPMLTLTKPALTESDSQQTDREDISYISQNVVEYLAYYDFENFIENLKNDQILVIDDYNAQIKNSLSNQLARLIKVGINDLLQVSVNLTDEGAYDSILAGFRAACEAGLEKVKKNKVPLYIEILANDDIGKIESLLTFLRTKYHPIILLYSDSELKNNHLNLIHAKVELTTSRPVLTIPLEKREYFGQPQHVKSPDIKEQPYATLSFALRTPFNTVTCITANPGSGKSSGFTESIRKWQSHISLSRDYHWLIHLNLNDITSDFLSENLALVLIKYLSQTLKMSLNNFERNFWTKVLDYDLANGYVKLLLDGWDEVKGHRIDICKNFMTRLPHTVHFDIAMRPYVLPDAPCRVYRLVELLPFTEHDLDKYLSKRFLDFSKAELKNSPENVDIPKNESVVQNKVRMFKMRTLMWLKSANERMLEVVKVPLLAFLLTSALQMDWLNWLKDKNAQSSNPHGPWDDEGELSLSFLYELFVITKAKRFLSKHLNVKATEVLSNSTIMLEVTSIYLNAIEEIAFNELFTTYLDTGNGNRFSHLHQALLSFGIIVGYQEDRISSKSLYHYQFIQQTFKEFFAAIYLIKALSLPRSHPSFKSAKRIIIKARYESTHKVVWAFIRDICEHDSLLLGQIKPSKDFLNIFINPNDNIGIAQHNLLVEVGLVKSQLITTQELKSIEIYTHTSDYQMEISTVSKTQLDSLRNIVDYSQLCELIGKLPTQIPIEIVDDYNTTMFSFLSHWSYRVMGKTASKLAESEVTIQPDMLPNLVAIIRDQRVYIHERRDAIKVMLKIRSDNFFQVVNVYQELLIGNIEYELKNTILISMYSIAGKDTYLDKKIIGIMQKQIVIDTSTVDAQECLFRQSIIIAKITRQSPTYDKTFLLSLVESLALNVNASRLELLLTMVNHGYFVLNEIKPYLLEGFKAYKNRQIVSRLLPLVLNFIKENNPIDGYSWLNLILTNDHDQTRESLLLELDYTSFEQEQEENYSRFWRIDAGIPIAATLLSTIASRTAFNYLLFQLKYKFNAYDVSRKIPFEIIQIKYNAKNGHMYLCLILEYLIIQQKVSSKDVLFRLDQHYFIRDLVETAWQHFTSGSNYPLIGIELIFAVGVCYGLPLVQQASSFILLFPNINWDPIISPPLTFYQQQVVVKHLESIHSLCQNYELSILKNGFNRLDSRLEKTAYIPFEKQGSTEEFLEKQVIETDTVKSLKRTHSKDNLTEHASKKYLTAIKKFGVVSNWSNTGSFLPSSDAYHQALVKFKSIAEILIKQNYTFNIHREGQLLTVCLLANGVDKKPILELLCEAIYNSVVPGIIIDFEVKSDRLSVTLITSQASTTLKKLLSEAGLKQPSPQEIKQEATYFDSTL